MLPTPPAPRPLCICPSPPRSPGLLRPQSWDTQPGPTPTSCLTLYWDLFKTLPKSEFAKNSLGWTILGSFKISNKVEVSKTRQRGFLQLVLSSTKAVSSSIQNE